MKAPSKVKEPLMRKRRTRGARHVAGRTRKHAPCGKNRVIRNKSTTGEKRSGRFRRRALSSGAWTGDHGNQAEQGHIDCTVWEQRARNNMHFGSFQQKISVQ